MSSARTSIAANPRQTWRTYGFKGACVALLALSAPTAEAATIGKTYFFATREACAASGAFTDRECAGAFANAQLQLRALAPRFDSSADCRMRFRLCTASRTGPQAGDALGYATQDEAVVFTPMALGVEMVASAKGAGAAPTLAVDTPARLFPYAPVSRPYEPLRPGFDPPGGLPENAAILAADHFEPFSKRKPFGGPMTFTASALGAIVGATHDAASAETREQRRARLKTAPFVE
ncbi:DUF1190 domain-containing protein [Methylocystis sp. Sn-Cys]|uniref:DUF1190 domain-containing protein n=1 Tax=Methylocystis sp. Sn-Cys TaxID=1701263 RepID=UPI001920AB5A|nr:DUF1190 domain-containing protein [Methylocystis sp. Sn-Cys]MBL1256609.1 DUF1190 domain-containing protein [Methylocystis sp. Sn-Cys]